MAGAFFNQLLALCAGEKQRQAYAPLNTVLQSPRLIIRAQDIDDEKAWLMLRRLSAPTLMPYEPQWPDDALTPRFFQGQWRRLTRRWVQDREYSFLIFSRNEAGGEPVLVGGISLSDIRRNVMQSAILGYWMGSPYTGKGYMREAIPLILDFGFHTLKLHRIEASCLPENERSLALLRGAGFRDIGLSKNYMQINGTWRDHVLFEKNA